MEIKLEIFGCLNQIIDIKKMERNLLNKGDFVQNLKHKDFIRFNEDRKYKEQGN